MNYKQTTAIPNRLFDRHMPDLSGSKLKVLLTVCRKTYGFVAKKGGRKKRDRISIGQLMTLTGLSRRAVSEAIQALVSKKLIGLTDYHRNDLNDPRSRKGKLCIYFSPLLQTSAESDINLCKKERYPVQKSAYNKTKETKEKRQKAKIQGKRKLTDRERYVQIASSCG